MQNNIQAMKQFKSCVLHNIYLIKELNFMYEGILDRKLATRYTTIII